MSMEISGILGRAAAQRQVSDDARTHRMPTLTEQAATRAEQTASPLSADGVDVKSMVEDLRIVASALDKRLKFSINQDLGQVVVKVIDRQTDKVIKELPPRELQRLHVRIREAIGLLIDEEI